MRVLVTGGAGYIGSHTMLNLLAEGNVPLVVDNFSIFAAALIESHDYPIAILNILMLILVIVI